MARSVGEGATGILDNPVVGMSPWIAFSLLSGPGRFEFSVVVALLITLVVVIGGRLARRGTSWKILEVADLVFFSVMAVIGALASAGTRHWLEFYAGEVSNIALTLIAFGSMAFRKPFTLQYAREQVDRKYWSSPTFLRTNYLITGVWGLAFLVSALAGGYGDLVLRNSNNLWTGWIIQIAALIAAVKFTAWYPGVATARARAEAAGHPRPAIDPSALLAPVAALLVPAGIAVLVFAGDLWWLGVAMIILGVAATRRLRRAADTPPVTPAGAPPAAAHPPQPPPGRE
ncbi:hypothetical protein [Streptomyces sp. NPDC097619]|uniref:hypothetical protein n=1 Tax=Streptomyces sp. NPDC097619 TaxID=3157228 RepID=UPI0033192615